MLSTGAIVATTILTARLLGPSGRGELTVATLLATLVVTLGSLGLGAAATFHTARGERDRSVVLGNSVLLGFILGVAILGVGVAIIAGGGITMRGVPASYLLLALLAVPFSLALGNVQSVYLGLQRFRAFNWITIGQAALPFLLIGSALLVFGGGVRAAVVATTASTVLLTLVAIIAAARIVGARWRPERGYVRAAASYGVRIHIANVLSFLGYRLDVFILDAYATTRAVGLYAAAVAVAERLWMPSQAVSTALFPSIAEERDEDVRRSITPLLARNTFWLTFVAAAFFYLLSGPIIALFYSSRFAPAAGALRALLPGIVTYSAARVLGNDIAGRGRPMLNSYLSGTSVLLNLGLNLFLIPRYGIVGASWASTASYSTLFVATAAVYCKIARVSARELIVPTRADGAAYLRLGKRLLSRSAPQDLAGSAISPPVVSLPDSESTDS